MLITTQNNLLTMCPGSSYPFYLVSYYIKWVTTPGHTVVVFVYETLEKVSELFLTTSRANLRYPELYFSW